MMVRDSSSGLPHQFVQLCDIPLLDAASQAYHRIEENTGNDRLVEHLQHFLTGDKGPQPPQEVKSALYLPVCVS